MMNTIFHKIASVLVAPFVFIGSLFNPSHLESPIEQPPQEIVQYDNQLVGAALPQATGVFETSLATPITSTATSMTLTSNAVRGGGSVSGYTCFTIDEGTAQAEVVCGTVSSTAVTSMTRGISYADGTTSVSANKFAHRRGASVKITDFPILQILKAQNNGDETFPNPLTYDSGVGPVDSSDLADKEYVLSVVNGGTVTFDKRIESGIAGESISAGKLVYLKASDGRWWLADADTASTVENVVLGIAQGSGTAGNAITGGVLREGTDTNQTGLSANTVYYASNTAGWISSSVGTKEVPVGIALSTTSISFNPRYTQQLTEDEQDAISGGSTFGTPSNTNKFVTQEYLYSSSGLPTRQTFTATSTTTLGDDTTQFDITEPVTDTMRYTYDGTGTNPSIDATSLPTGTPIVIESSSMTAANTGFYVVTGSGSNYFEISNAPGVAEVNKTLTNGTLKKISSQTWTKPANLKFITLEMVAAGAAGRGVGVNTSPARGGGAGGYARKTIAAASLGSTETLYVGVGGVSNSITNDLNYPGFFTKFGSHVTCNPGSSSSGGTCTGGDLNITGGAARGFVSSSSGFSGAGGDSWFGFGGAAVTPDSSGVAGQGYGSGGSGAAGDASSSAAAGGSGANGIILITEYYQ